MREALEAALAAVAGGRAAALVTPVVTEGSLPTGRLARMLVHDDGSGVGTVGGGKMEAEVAAAAARAAGHGAPRLVEFSLTAADAMADGLLCGGRVTFLVEPLGPAAAAALRAVHAAVESGTPALEAVRLDDEHMGERLVLTGPPGAARTGSLGGCAIDAAVEALVAGALEEEVNEVRALEAGGERAEVYLNALSPRPTLFLFGGGHVGLALARLAPTAGFRLVVVDDREEFASRERFPMAEQVLVRPFRTAAEGLELGRLSFAAIMTRGHRWDREVLAQILRSDAAYVGMIGSRRKTAATWEALRQEGFSDTDLERVHAPIGLPIGGDSPGEIAISIMAQLIQVYRLGKGPLDGPTATEPRSLNGR